MKKFFISMIIMMMIVLPAGCGREFTFDITSSPKKTQIRINNAEDGAYMESSSILINKNSVIAVDSALDKGALKIEFVEAYNIATSDGPDNYVTGKTAKTIEVAPGDAMEITVDPGEYVLYLTVIGQTNGTVTLNIDKK